MNLMNWSYWLIALTVSILTAEFHGRHVKQQEWNIDKAKQEQQASDLLKQRQAENDALITHQTTINTHLQKAYENEIRTVTAALAHSDRLRIGSRFCADTARQAYTQSPVSSNETNTTSRILSDEVDSIVRQLILETEEAAATGRAAQTFIRENGLAVESSK